MLSLFPQILFLTPFSATLLRITAGLVFFYLAYVHYGNRKAVAQEISYFVGGASIVCAVYILIELLVAFGLFLGIYAQLAALVGLILALKILIVRKSLREVKPLSELSYVLLAVICLSVLVTGAGIFAFDLPL